jgi:hypothetical protein
MAAYNGVMYYMENKGAKINAALVGEYIGRAAAEGEDEYYIEHYPDNIRFHGCDVYTLKNISPKCAVAIKYDGYSGFFTFSNWNYSPETLGDFAADLNLRENLVAKTIHDSYSERLADGEGIRRLTQYEPPEMSVVWDMLFSDLSINNKGSVNRRNIDDMYMAVDVKAIGVSNVLLAVSEDGYLHTNILGIGKTFYIGKNETNAFINYVHKNCKVIPPPPA